MGSTWSNLSKHALSNTEVVKQEEEKRTYCELLCLVGENLSHYRKPSVFQELINKRKLKKLPRLADIQTPKPFINRKSASTPCLAKPQE